jgi:hypothetical protein
MTETAITETGMIETAMTETKTKGISTCQESFEIFKVLRVSILSWYQKGTRSFFQKPFFQMFVQKQANK